MCSDLPSFTDPVCLIRDGCVRGLIDGFLEHIGHVTVEAERLMRLRFQTLLATIRRSITEKDKTEQRWSDPALSNKHTYASRQRICGLLQQFEQYLRAVPVLGFNSQCYDLNVLKSTLMRTLHEKEPDNFRFIVKKTNSMTCVETARFRFMGLCNFIALSFSYAKYVTALGCEQTKGYFPYEWMDLLDKLTDTQLPPRELFDSLFKDSCLTAEKYEVCHSAWCDESMATFKDIVMWYNNLDVVPLLEVVDKQSRVYAVKGINMFEDTISLPGLAAQWMFTECAPERAPTLADGDAELYHHLSSGIAHQIAQQRRCRSVYADQEQSGGRTEYGFSQISQVKSHKYPPPKSVWQAPLPM